SGARSVHVRRSRVQELAAQEHRLRGDYLRHWIPARLLGRRDDAGDEPVQADAVNDSSRARLLKAAERLFADRGFRNVTVREICRAARANVAAVNYHFGDKLGLYRQVLQLAIDRMRATNEAAKQAGVGRPAEEQLRRYISIFIHRLLSNTSDTVHR